MLAFKVRGACHWLGKGFFSIEGGYSYQDTYMYPIGIVILVHFTVRKEWMAC